jgi:hypothetical protein
MARITKSSPGLERAPAILSSESASSESAPTPSAKMTISLRPDQFGGSAEVGNVPADQAHHLITTFGVVVIGFGGIGGAVLTFYISSRSMALALAELALALAIAVLIAVCSRGSARRRSESETVSATSVDPPRKRRRIS